MKQITKLCIGMFMLLLCNAEQQQNLYEKIADKSLKECYQMISTGELKWKKIESKDIIEKIEEKDAKAIALRDIEAVQMLRQKFLSEMDYNKLFNDASYALVWHSQLEAWELLFSKYGGRANLVLATACDSHLVQIEFYLAAHGKFDLARYYKADNDVKHLDVKAFLIEYARNDSERNFANNLTEETIFTLNEKIDRLLNSNLKGKLFVKSSESINNCNQFDMLMRVTNTDCNKTEVLRALQKYLKMGLSIEQINSISNEAIHKLTDGWQGSYLFFKRNNIGLDDVKNALQDYVISDTTSIERVLKTQFQ